MLKTLKRLLYVILVLLFLAGTLALAWWLGPGNQRARLHKSLSIEQVQMLSELVTTRVQINDVQETAIRGHFGGRKVVLVVKGDVLIGVDLSQARFAAMDQKACTAALLLPQPRVISVRLDHDHTRIADDNSEGLWTIVAGDGGRTATVNRAYARAQQYVSESATDAELIEKSRRHAEEVFGSFFAGMGWTVSVRWM